jgi:hypothetical protein
MGFLTIVEKGLQESPPPKRELEQKGRARNSQERNLLLRLQKQKEVVLRFYSITSILKRHLTIIRRKET